MRIVNETFPSDGGPWFFKVRPHHDQETVTQRIGNRLQPGGILIGGVGVMDGARSYDDQKPVSILSMENSANRFSGFDDECRGLISNRQFSLNGAWGRQCLDFNDMLIVDRSIHEDYVFLKISFLLRSQGDSNLSNHAGKVHTGRLSRYIQFDGAPCRHFLQF